MEREPVGTPFGSWTSCGPAYVVKSGTASKRYLPCRCVCGTRRDVQLDSLRAGMFVDGKCLRVLERGEIRALDQQRRELIRSGQAAFRRLKNLS
jgi:hypothetical protein